MEHDIDELYEAIREEDRFLRDEEEEGEEPSELSKDLTDHAEDKDRLIGGYNQERDEALFDRENVREDKTLLLDQIKQTLERDINKMDELLEEIPRESEQWDKVYDIKEELLQRQAEASSLSEQWHCNDLPPINDKFPQDSSDIHQTDFDSSDHYED